MRFPCPLRGGLGGGGQRALNFAQYPFEILENVVIPEAQDAIARSFNALCSRRIRRLLPIVLPAVEFNHQLCPAACEIDNEGTNHSLSAKMRTD
jgi:hypothetical protein